VLLASSMLEFDAHRENAAEPIARRLLQLLADSDPDPATRVLRASGQVTLGEIRLNQGHVAEALALMESARRGLAAARTPDNKVEDPARRIADVERQLARARVRAGDLDGALSGFQELLRAAEPCNDEGPAVPACRSLGVLESWTADVYAAVDRPNLGEPAKAARLYEHALHIQERVAALDDRDRQARFDLAARYGKLGDAIWMSDPSRALDLYDRALATAKTLVSKEQLEIFRGSYLLAVTRPLIQAHRLAEARKALTDVLNEARASAQAPGAEYADRVGEIAARLILPDLLVAEGKRPAAAAALRDIISDIERLRGAKADDLTPIFYLSQAYRALAAISADPERREALLSSARAWHSWPATTFTNREEQRDLEAASRHPDSGRPRAGG